MLVGVVAQTEAYALDELLALPLEQLLKLQISSQRDDRTVSPLDHPSRRRTEQRHDS